MLSIQSLTDSLGLEQSRSARSAGKNSDNLTEADSPSKTLVLVGGNWQYPATEDPYGVSIYLDILERAGGVENAKIGILTTASASGKSAKENGELYVQDFEDLYDLYLKEEYPNAQIDVEWISFHIDNHEKKEDNKALIKQIKSRTAIIFGGGDQSLITESFFNENAKTGQRTKTPILKALEKAYEKGTVIAGTSAGTTVQTDSSMITEGESYESLLNEPTRLIGSPPFVRDLHFNPLGGLGLFEYGLLDTHFSERGRQGRIIRLAAEVDESMTYGVDENTALIVTDVGTPDVRMEVLGQNGVFISDLSKATVDDSGKYWSISGVNNTYLTEGDRFDPLTKQAKFPGKDRLKGNEDSAPKTNNVFSFKNENGKWTNPRAFTETAIELFESKAAIARGRSLERQPVRYDVTLTETKKSKGFVGLDSLGEERVSFSGLQVDITPFTPDL